MRRYIRTATPGACYFFTLALQDRSTTLLVDRIDDLRSAFREVKARHPFVMDAVAILPEHLHAMWTLPPGDGDYAKRWALIKGAFTKQVGAGMRRAARGERSVWQPRYWEHQIRDEQDFARHVDYIHFNPVKHGHAALAADWPHSSFHRYVREGKLPQTWGMRDAVAGGFGE